MTFEANFQVGKADPVPAASTSVQLSIVEDPSLNAPALVRVFSCDFVDTLLRRKKKDPRNHTNNHEECGDRVHLPNLKYFSKNLSSQ